jgi:hypothetical protein
MSDHVQSVLDRHGIVSRGDRFQVPGEEGQVTVTGLGISNDGRAAAILSRNGYAAYTMEFWAVERVIWKEHREPTDAPDKLYLLNDPQLVRLDPEQLSSARQITKLDAHRIQGVSVTFELVRAAAVPEDRLAGLMQINIGGKWAGHAVYVATTETELRLINRLGHEGRVKEIVRIQYAEHGGRGQGWPWIVNLTIDFEADRVRLVVSRKDPRNNTEQELVATAGLNGKSAFQLLHDDGGTKTAEVICGTRVGQHGPEIDTAESGWKVRDVLAYVQFRPE